MERTNPKVAPTEVRKVQERFEHWRSGKQQGRERIPQKLWRAAAKLCETHSINRVARWLQLNHTALQEQTNRRSSPRHSQPKPTFIEWGLPGGIVPGNSSAEYVVEVDGRGDRVQRIHVRGASVLEVATMVRALSADENVS